MRILLNKVTSDEGNDGVKVDPLNPLPPASESEPEDVIKVNTVKSEDETVLASVHENSKVATMGLETVNQMPWTEIKQLMTVEFCLVEEIHRIEHELWNMKSESGCLHLGIIKEIKGEVTSSKPTNLNEAVRMAYKFMEQKLQSRDERILEGKKQK
nr:hypothetical protein [Tanacetum cinerariifolium]